MRSGKAREFGSVVSLADLQCRKTILKMADGEQHVLLRDEGRIAQLRCVGDDIRAHPFALELVVDRFPDIEACHRLFRRLAELYLGRRRGGHHGDWTVEAMRHRDALAALDLRADGRSYR
ncbi:MAG TPA: hypothetical protein VNH64_09805, partial [Parvularculaceae bacterium]|nr:hypothetical protein [Parvularculaceae bacterium]